MDFYYRQNPNAAVTGIDLAPGMLSALKAKFPGKNITLIQGSYFDIPLGHECYDAVVSVESLHHFTKKRKLSSFRSWNALKSEQGISDQAFYHYDTPLTAAHEMQVLELAGFHKVEHLAQWGDTHCRVLRNHRCPFINSILPKRLVRADGHTG